MKTKVPHAGWTVKVNVFQSTSELGPLVLLTYKGKVSIVKEVSLCTIWGV